MSEIIVMTEERLRQIIKESIPAADKISPEDKYVTTEQLAKIFKVAVSTIHKYKDLGMDEYGFHGENLWDWTQALWWRTHIYPKLTQGNRRKLKK